MSDGTALKKWISIVQDIGSNLKYKILHKLLT